MRTRYFLEFDTGQQLVVSGLRQTEGQLTALVDNGAWNLTYRDGLVITGRGDKGTPAMLVKKLLVPPDIKSHYQDVFDWYNRLYEVFPDAEI